MEHFTAIIVTGILFGMNLLLKEIGDLAIIFLFIFYYVWSKLFTISSRVTFEIAILCLGAMFLSFSFYRHDVRTERWAVWLVLFLFYGIVQQSIAILFKPKK